MKLKNLNQKLKVSILFILINFLFCPSILFASSTNIDYCKKNSKFFSGFENKTLYPKFIDVTIPNSHKWFRKVIRSVAIGGGSIPKINKTYQKVKLDVHFSDEIVCSMKGDVKIHGGGNDHIDNKNFNTSLRIHLSNSHINFVHKFTLLLPKTRNFNEEIFASTLSKELGFLTPDYYKVKVRINNREIADYLFMEMPSLEMMKNQKRNNGFFLTGNGNNNQNIRTSSFDFRRSYILTRLKSIDNDGISEKNKNAYLFGLDKLNYEYLNVLGLGDGRNCCANSELKLASNYKRGIVYLSNLKKETNSNYKEISSFHLLMKAVNATHGLALEDRLFYYNPMQDILEPIYNDAGPDILSKKGLTRDPINFGYITENEIKHIGQLQQKINKLNKIDIRDKLFLKGLYLQEKEIDRLFDKIIKNLEQMKTYKEEKHESLYTKNYFKNHFESKSLNFYLLFGGFNNNFEICNIDLTNCEKKELSNKQFYKVLKDKFSIIDNKELLYIRTSKEDYLNNNEPKKHGLKNFKKIKIDNDNYLYFNGKFENIKIDKKIKKIDLLQDSENDRFVFFRSTLDNWNISLVGINKDEKISYKRDQNMLGGCLNFVDSRFSNISFKSINAKCPNSIEILNSNGSFNNIHIVNSSLDSFDSEFSNLLIKKIYVKKSKGECIGVKRGKYIFEDVELHECYDKAISSGEHSFTEIHKAIIKDSSNGIIAKDSSTVIVHNLNLKNTNKCLHAYRGKPQYNGARIVYDKKKVFCNGNPIMFDNNSIITSSL